MKKNSLALILFTFFLLGCADSYIALVERTNQLALLPQAKESLIYPKSVILSPSSQMYSSDPQVRALLALLSSELEQLHHVKLEVGETQNRSSKIIFEIDPNLAAEEYVIDVAKYIMVTGGNYQALAMAKASLLQLSHVQKGAIAFPLATIRDFPDASYRGLMIDLARKWHSMASVKKMVDLAAYYKIKYLHLHFTDDQSFTLPIQAYPKLATPGRHYSREELVELEAYSQLRGVTIIPELEVPGHSTQFVKKYPEIFAIKDTATNSRIVNMGSEEAYTAIEKIVGEITEIFSVTPYLHLGGDEANFRKVMDDPKVQAYIKKHSIEADAHELYRHFLVRMNEIVKKHKKQMCIWEGFGPKGSIEIPKDIIVFEFETNRYLPNLLIEDGYTVVNTSWQPLYVVNKRKWDPTQIYDWNMWRWENWWDQAPSFDPIQLEKTPLIIGAQMCAWEQPEEAELPSLRKRVPAFVERIWNTKQNLAHDQLIHLIKQTDQRFSVLVNDDRQEK